LLGKLRFAVMWGGVGMSCSFRISYTVLRETQEKVSRRVTVVLGDVRTNRDQG